MPTTRVVTGPLRRLPFDAATDQPTLTRLPASATMALPLHQLAPPKGPPAPAPAPVARPAIPPPADRSIGMGAPSGGSWVGGVVRAAREQNIDPSLALAIALEESGGNPRVVGDQGTSVGLFQLHQGGALGRMSFAEAQDPYTNAMAVLPSWNRLGGGRGLDPRAAFMQYYHGVGRGSSDTIPTSRALGLLAQARQLYAQYGGGGGAPSPGAPTSPTGGGGGSMTAPPAMDPRIGQALQAYLARSSQAVMRGESPGLPTAALGMLGLPAEFGSWLGRSQKAVLAGESPPPPPLQSLLAALAVRQAQEAQPPLRAGQQGRYTGAIPGPIAGVDYPLGARGPIIGTPYSGTHTLGNWESDNAVDISVPVGTPVVAPTDGVVGSQIGALDSSNPRMAGLRVHVDGPADSFYLAHLSRLTVRAGEQVRAGQIIGYSGSANGVAHLHFASEHRDPRQYIGQQR